MIEVTISPDDAAHAMLVASARWQDSRARGWTHKGEVLGSVRQDDAERMGAIAEVAVCRAYGLPLRSVRSATAADRRDPDVGGPGGVDVRATHHEHGRLLIKRSDAAHRPHVLVVVHPGYCRIVGWCYGLEARRQELWVDAWGCYAVPQIKLRDPMTLEIGGRG